MAAWPPTYGPASLDVAPWYGTGAEAERSRTGSRRYSRVVA
jgi:hypothetical protein